MDVLQDTVSIIRRPDTHQLRHQVVPGAGQVANTQLFSENGLFQPVTHYHVQRVGDFIGEHPDQPRFNLAVNAQDIVGFPGGTLSAQDALGRGCQEADKFFRARSLHFQKQ